MIKKELVLGWIILIFTVPGFSVYCLDNAKADIQKANIVVVGTGGTIAGESEGPGIESYTAGKVSVQRLINDIPGITKFADIQCDQVSNVPSQDITEVTLLSIARKVNELARNSNVDGIVITHGTDTMEETAYFLDMTIHTNKPIVITGAMRPSNSLSADGPINLFNSIAVAASKEAIGMGVLIVMNDKIMLARECTKSNTTNVDTFVCRNTGNSGFVNYGKVRIYTKSTRLNTENSPFNIEEIKTLPKVAVLCSAQGEYLNDFIDCALKNGYKGLVIDGLGDGNVFDKNLEALRVARSKGIPIVISSRVGSGVVLVNSEMNDTKYKFNTADDLNSDKARILLMLALTKTKDYLKIQEYFDEC